VPMRAPVLIALLPFFLSASILRADWREEADARIEKIRKGDFSLHLTGTDGKPLAGRVVHLHQTGSDFHFGVAIAEHLIGGHTKDSRNYEQFVIDHFNTIVCENSMKWYSTEKYHGMVSYWVPDKVMRFAKAHGLAVRGHSLFWARSKFVQPWVQRLAPGQLRAAIDARLNSIVPRYKGRVLSWDVNNEMLDGSFFRDRLGPGIDPYLFKRAHQLDPGARLFVNEYGILANDQKLGRYMAEIRSLRAAGAPVGGIGIQEHAAERFSPAPVAAGAEPERAGEDRLVPEEVWRRLDRLGKLGLPIELTEVSAKTSDPVRRADALETLFRVAFAHPKVDTVLLWGFWAKAHWLGPDAALVDKDWKVLPAGERISKLILQEWRTNRDATTDAEGNVSFRGFYGSYAVTAPGAGGRQLTGSVLLTATSTAGTVALHY